MFLLSLSYLIVFLSYLGLLLVAANVFTRKHTLRFHRPAVGDEFRISSECLKNSEALLIALSAAPHLFEGYDLGLVEAVDSISKDDCFPRSPQTLSVLTVDEVRNRYEWAKRELIETAPPWYLGKYTAPPIHLRYAQERYGWCLIIAVSLTANQLLPNQ